MDLNNSLLINDYTYIQLFNRNIWSSIQKVIRSFCDRCSKKSDKIYDNNRFYSYCEQCVKLMLDLYINQLVIKEEYGKGIFLYI